MSGNRRNYGNVHEDYDDDYNNSNSSYDNLSSNRNASNRDYSAKPHQGKWTSSSEVTDFRSNNNRDRDSNWNVTFGNNDNDYDDDYYNNGNSGNWRGNTSNRTYGPLNQNQGNWGSSSYQGNQYDYDNDYDYLNSNRGNQGYGNNSWGTQQRNQRWGSSNQGGNWGSSNQGGNWGSSNQGGNWGSNSNQSGNSRFGRSSNRRGNNQPLVDIHDAGSEYVIDMELPGYTRETIEMKLYGNELSVIARPTARGNLNYVVNERNSQETSRTLSLPLNADTRKINAVLTNGLLRVNIPKITGTQLNIGSGNTTGNTGTSTGLTGSNSGLTGTNSGLTGTSATQQTTTTTTTH